MKGFFLIFYWQCEWHKEMLFKPSFKEGHYKYISNEYNHNPHSANWAPLFQSTQRLPAGILIIKQI